MSQSRGLPEVELRSSSPIVSALSRKWTKSSSSIREDLWDKVLTKNSPKPASSTRDSFAINSKPNRSLNIPKSLTSSFLLYKFFDRKTPRLATRGLKEHNHTISTNQSSGTYPKWEAIQFEGHQAQSCPRTYLHGTRLPYDDLQPYNHNANYTSNYVR